MSEKRYQVGKIRNVIKESTSEFKPKLGNGVESGNKESGKDFYREVEKEIKNFDGGLQEPKKKEKLPQNNDLNKCLLDYNIENASDDYKARVKAQVLGYTSTQEQNNGIEKSGADFDGNEVIYDHLADKKEKKDKIEKNMEISGLAARERYKQNPEMFEKDNVFKKGGKTSGKNEFSQGRGEENARKEVKEGTTKRLNFKHTRFMNEEHMLSRIPESYKVDEARFWMKDCAGNDYLIEWHKKGEINEGEVLKYQNKEAINEQMSRIKSLFDYRPSEHANGTSMTSRLNEDKEFINVLNKVRS